MSVTERGQYGPYGGRYVPETLVPALEELERGWDAAREDAGFRAELADLQGTYVGRPTPLYRAERLRDKKRLYLKREDLCHTGAHKINNALGQALLARRQWSPSSSSQGRSRTRATSVLSRSRTPSRARWPFSSG